MDKTHQQWRKDMANRKTRFFHLGRTLKLFVIALTLVWVLAGASLLEASTERIRLALSEITPYGSIELPGAQSRLSVFLPIPQRWQINQARLLISYTNSSALLADRSRLVISLNDYVLGQKTLHPESSEGQWELELPAALLPADYNALEFRVIQNYTYECSDPTAPELWTRLNLDQSYLELDYSWREKSLTLADISNYVFDPKLPGRTALHLIMPALDKESLRLAALAASAAAVRYEYRPVEITISDRPASNRDNIYIGDRKTLAGLLDRKDTSLPSGRIGIMALPADGGPDPRFVLLTLTGDTAEEVERSVRAFALISYPWPQETSISPTKVEWPDVTRYSGKGVLKPGEIYFFRDLGTPTATRRGTGPGPIDVRFRLPGDVVSPSNAPFVVSLNLAYGAGMRAESTLNILLNGEFVSAVPLNEPRGGLFQAYRVNVPTKYLKAGANTLTFDPVLGLEQRGPCQYQESWQPDTDDFRRLDHKTSQYGPLGRPARFGALHHQRFPAQPLAGLAHDHAGIDRQGLENRGGGPQYSRHDQPEIRSAAIRPKDDLRPRISPQGGPFAGRPLEKLASVSPTGFSVVHGTEIPVQG
jgi:hypothetical protein